MEPGKALRKAPDVSASQLLMLLMTCMFSGWVPPRASVLPLFCGLGRRICTGQWGGPTHSCLQAGVSFLRLGPTSWPGKCHSGQGGHFLVCLSISTGSAAVRCFRVSLRYFLLCPLACGASAVIYLAENSGDLRSRSRGQGEHPCLPSPILASRRTLSVRRGCTLRRLRLREG